MDRNRSGQLVMSCSTNVATFQRPPPSSYLNTMIENRQSTEFSRLGSAHNHKQMINKSKNNISVLFDEGKTVLFIIRLKLSEKKRSKKL